MFSLHRIAPTAHLPLAACTACNKAHDRHTGQTHSSNDLGSRDGSLTASTVHIFYKCGVQAPPPPPPHTHMSLSQRRPKVAEVEPQGIPSCTPPPPCPHSYPLVQAAAEMKRLEAMQRTRGRGRRRRREPSPPTQWAQRVSSKSGSSNWRSPHSSGLPWPAGEGTRSRLDPQTGPRGGPKQTFSLTPGRLAQPEANWYHLQTNQYRFQAN